MSQVPVTRYRHNTGPGVKLWSQPVNIVINVELKLLDLHTKYLTHLFPFVRDIPLPLQQLLELDEYYDGLAFMLKYAFITNWVVYLRQDCNDTVTTTSWSALLFTMTTSPASLLPTMSLCHPSVSHRASLTIPQWFNTNYSLRYKNLDLK